MIFPVTHNPPPTTLEWTRRGDLCSEGTKSSPALKVSDGETGDSFETGDSITLSLDTINIDKMTAYHKVRSCSMINLFAIISNAPECSCVQLTPCYVDRE